MACFLSPSASARARSASAWRWGRARTVLRDVLARGMGLAAIGVTVGLAAALWAARLLKTLLFGVSARDPLIYGAVILGVVLVALLANLVPARRAAAVDPMRALRFE